MELCRCCHFEVPADSSKNILHDRYDNKILLDVITKITDVKIFEDDPFPKDICYHCYQILMFICDFIKLVTRTDRKFHRNVNDNNETFSTEPETNQNYCGTVDNMSVEEIVTEVDVFYDDSRIEDSTNLGEPDTLNIENGIDNPGIVEINSDDTESPGGPVEPKTEHKCPICNRSFARRYNVKRHLRTQHKQNSSSNVRNSNSARRADQLKNNSSVHDNGYVCNICSKVFCRKYHLIRHLSIHAVAKMFNCKICKKSYTQRYDLKRHLVTHNKDRLFVCYICDKIFNRKYELDRHMLTKTIHKRKKSISCHSCNEQFTDEDSLQQHFIPDIDKNSFNCKICHKNFNVKCSLNQHMASHLGD